MLSLLARRWVFLLLMMLTSIMVFVPGCGDDDGGGGNPTPDATPNADSAIDTGTGTVDAGRDNNVTPADSGTDATADADAAATTFSIGGTVTGLAGATGLVLQLNGANNLTIPADGAFAFATKLANGASYSVTIGTQPTGKTCTVSAGSGTIANANVTGVVVNCAANTFTVGGSINGLAAGASVTLLNNGGNALVRNANGAFAFTTPIATGATYAVTVSVQPTTPAQVCTVTNGTGTMANANVTSVNVTCVTSTFTVGGNVTGLAAGGSVVLQNNAGDNLTVNANGAFTFATSVASGAAYAVTVLTNPSNPAQTCTVANATGMIAAANVTNVAVTCATTNFTVGGSLSGLGAGGTIVLQNNGGDNLSLTANGNFTFATSVASGAPYNVTILTQPAGQACTVSAGSGNVGGGNVTTVVVNCGNTYTVGGTVTGLGAGTLILNNNGVFDSVNITGNGNFAFSEPLLDGAAYAVTIGTQPSNPTQTCVITSGSGNIAAANVTNVAVTCSTNVYKVGGTIAGLAPGQTASLQNNGGDTIIVAANGNFVFPTDIASGANYAVTVSTQPAAPIAQTCTVANATGAVGAADVTNVQVTCTANRYTIGGNTTGLAAGATLVLQNNGGDNLTVTNNGAFTFATSIASGQTYTASVLTNPGTPSQACTITAGTETGTVTNANITSIAVSCATNSFTVGGTLVGLDTTAGNTVTIQNNAGDDITLNANGGFTFATPVLSGTNFAVTVSAQPTSPAQTCNVSAGGGTMGGANVTGVVVNCATNTYTIGGNLTNLAPGNTVVLQNNGGNDLSLTSNGAFAFSTPILSGATYAVTVLTSPTAPISQNCTVTGLTGAGTVAAANITSVAINCTTNAFAVGGSVTGLAAGNTVVLRNNGADDLNVNANGPFNFATSISSGNAYNVTVATNPSTPIEQVCTPTVNTGTIGNAAITNVVITCVTTQYQVSATVFGLAQGSLVLQNNGADNVTRSANGTFQFTTLVNNGSPYSVTILQQPNVQQQICQVVDGAGTMPAANVTNVAIFCGWTCQSIRNAEPTFPTGPYVIDPDGSGPIAQFTATCDMTYDGGGWTLAQATVSPLGPTEGTAGSVIPGTASYMPLNVVAALARLSQRVHVRSPATPPTVFVTSTAGSVPILNLRSGNILNRGVPGGSGVGYIGRTYWTISGAAPTADISMFDTPTALALPAIDPGNFWPNVFNANDNVTTGFRVTGAETRWQSQLAETSLEVYLK